MAFHVNISEWNPKVEQKMSDYFPPNVVNEILRRLPVKPLLRFRCVCKDWCSLISSPKFISQHLSLSSSDHSRTLVRYYCKIHSKEIYAVYKDESFNKENSTSISFPFHEKSKLYYHIVGYCNGLLCLSDDLFRYRETKTFLIWNPSIKKAINVRPPRVIFKRSSKNCMFALGFGFDSENDDYKIVRLAYFFTKIERRHALPPLVEVFSLSTRTWRQINNKVESYISDHIWSQAFVHGAVHWVAFKMTRNDQEINKRYRNSILKFNFSSDEFVELGLPEALTYVQPIRILATTVRGRLAIVYNDTWMRKVLSTDTDNSCSIWVMKEYNNVESWTLVFKVRLESTGLDRVLDVKRSGIVFSGSNGELFFYDFQNKVATNNGIPGTTYSLFAEKYVESLVLLDDGKEVWGTEPESNQKDLDENIEVTELMALRTKSENIISLYLQP